MDDGSLKSNKKAYILCTDSFNLNELKILQSLLKLRYNIHCSFHKQRDNYRIYIPVKHYLESFEIVQTTYNKKKRANESLSKQDSEFIVELTELYAFGESVFNNETDKFQRWLKKQNISLGNIKPYNMFDSLVGINEVKKALNRLEYGNMA